MILQYLWERHLFWSLLATFLFIVSILFGFFVILDYTMHTHDFFSGHALRVSQLFLYYTFHLATQVDLLLPFSFLIASLKTIFSLNEQGMLVALLSSGISMRRILRPFLLLAFLCTLCIYVNYEIFLPKGFTFLKQFRKEHMKSPTKRRSHGDIHVLFLQDQSKILYSYETAEKYHDVYWIVKPNEIWRMQSLSKESPDAKGYWVDHLVRRTDGYFEKRDSHPVCLFSGVIPQQDPTGKGYIPAENRKISELLFLKKTGHHEPAKVTTALVYKCCFPLLALLIAFAIPTLGLRQERRKKVFIAYAFSLFAFIAFIAFLNASMILGESEILSPYLGILLPFVLLFSAFGYRLVKNT